MWKKGIFSYNFAFFSNIFEKFSDIFDTNAIFHVFLFFLLFLATLIAISFTFLVIFLIFHKKKTYFLAKFQYFKVILEKNYYLCGKKSIFSYKFTFFSNIFVKFSDIFVKKAIFHVFLYFLLFLATI